MLSFDLFLYRDRMDLQDTDVFDGPVVLGRQRAGESLFAQVAAGGLIRYIIADSTDPHIDEEHLRLEPLSDGRMRLTNLSKQTPVRLTEPDAALLAPGSACEVVLPLLLTLGQIWIRVQRPLVQRLTEATPPHPLAIPVPPLPSLVEHGQQVPFERLVQWLNAAVDVLVRAVDDPGHFHRIAAAVAQTVWVQSVRVLLWKDGQWQSEAEYNPSGSPLNPLSQSVLAAVRRDRCAVWEIPPEASEKTHAYLKGIIAAPILSKDRQVVGAIYGERDGPATKSQAELVNFLASGVSTGLLRKAEAEEAVEYRARFEQFFTPELSRHLAERPELLDDRELPITILVCDIRGFSRISRHLEGKMASEWARDVRDELSKCVWDVAGVVVDYAGDGLLAMWGAPKEQADQADRACRAALAMRKVLEPLNRAWQQRPQWPRQAKIDVGIGIHAANVWVGNSGSRQKLKYGPGGPAVNLASRIEGATKHLRCPILLTQDARDKVDQEKFNLRCVGEIQPPDNDPVRCHELVTDLPWPECKHRYEEALKRFEDRRFVACVQELSIWLGECRARLGEGKEDLLATSLLIRAATSVRDGAAQKHPVLVLDKK